MTYLDGRERLTSPATSAVLPQKTQTEGFSSGNTKDYLRGPQQAGVHHGIQMSVQTQLLRDRFLKDRKLEESNPS